MPSTDSDSVRLRLHYIESERIEQIRCALSRVYEQFSKMENKKSTLMEVSVLQHSR